MKVMKIIDGRENQRMRGSILRRASPGIIELMRFASSLVLLLLVPLAGAQWRHAEAVDASVEAYRLRYRVAGLSVGIMKGGRQIYARGFGFADEARSQKADERTLYRLASVSKPITGILAMSLVQSGRLDLDWDVRRLLPELPSHHSYALRALLDHRSGVRHYVDSDPIPALNRKFEWARDVIPYLAKDPLVMQPGTGERYSTHAYTLFAAAMERAKGEPFREFADRSFARWGLTALRNETMSPRAARSEVYTLVGERRVAGGRDDTSWKSAGGGMESDVLDLCRLGHLLVTGRVLRKETVQQMWARQRPDDESGRSNGWVKSSFQGKRTVGHSGSQLGANSYWLIFPDEDVVVAVLTNTSGNNPQLLARYLARAAFLSEDEVLAPLELPPPSGRAR